LSATLVTCPSIGSGDQSEAHQMLLREANLVEYFCLSRIPPVIGRSSVPSEWETALKTTIRLRGNVGEIAAMSPEFKSRLEELRGLQPGQSLFTTSSTESGRQNVLVYQPKTGGTTYLVLMKSAAETARENGGSCGGYLWLTLLIGIAGGLIVTGLAAALGRRTISG
ncbi:MAG: hypothetical protein PHI18_08725, partial [bacterium]|nr:hypothetical protein [bacterium]